MSENDDDSGGAAPGSLTFFCGKMGAGKTTLASRLAAARRTVLIAEDDWLARLSPAEIVSLSDYIERSGRLRPVVKELVCSILSAGTDVVMDFPANTLRQRAWFHSIFTDAGAPHELIHIAAPDASCLERIARRRIEQPERAATDTPEMFEQVNAYFVPPGDDEGFRVTEFDATDL